MRRHDPQECIFGRGLLQGWQARATLEDAESSLAHLAWNRWMYFALKLLCLSVLMPCFEMKNG